MSDRFVGADPRSSRDRPRALVMVTDGAIDWGPLERLEAVVASTAAGSRFGLDADDFMWMGQGDLDDGTRLQLYKHRDTRRYLNLDDAGHAYRYDHRCGGYVVYAHPGDAIGWVTAADLQPSLASTILAGWQNSGSVPLPSRGPEIELGL